MDLGDLQPFATALAGGAAIITIVVGLMKERHPLSLVERLTSVASNVRDGEARRVIEDYRDARVVSWVLAQRAPQERGLLNLGRWLRGGAVLFLVLWAVSSTLDRTNLWVWVLYGVAIGLAVVSGVPLRRRLTLQDDWVRQEREWRSLPPVSPSKRVVV